MSVELKKQKNLNVKYQINKFRKRGSRLRILQPMSLTFSGRDRKRLYYVTRWHVVSAEVFAIEACRDILTKSKELFKASIKLTN